MVEDPFDESDVATASLTAEVLARLYRELRVDVWGNHVKVRWVVIVREYMKRESSMGNDPRANAVERPVLPHGEIGIQHLR